MKTKKTAKGILEWTNKLAIKTQLLKYGKIQKNEAFLNYLLQFGIEKAEENKIT